MGVFRKILFVVNTGLIVVWTLWGISVDLRPLSYVMLLMTNIYMLIGSRRNFMLFMIAFMITFSNYSIVYATYIGHFENTIYTTIISQPVYITSLNILVIFNLLLFFFFNWKKTESLPSTNIFVYEENRDYLISLILIMVLVAIFVFGFKRPDEMGKRGSPSALYEYSLIFFAMLFYYSGNNKRVRNIGLFLVVLFSSQNFVFGGRISGLQFLLGSYIMLFMDRVSNKVAVILAFIAFLFFSIIGVVRGELASMNYDVFSIVENVFNKGLALDTAYSSFFTSETFVYVADQISPERVHYYFSQWVKSMFLGTAVPDSQLANISLRYIEHTYGGVLPFFFYFYLGGFAIVIPVLLVSVYLLIVRNLNSNTSGYFKCLAVYITCHTFRWYLYTPSGLIRGVMLYSIVYYICHVFHIIHMRNANTSSN